MTEANDNFDPLHNPNGGLRRPHGLPSHSFQAEPEQEDQYAHQSKASSSAEDSSSSKDPSPSAQEQANSSNWKIEPPELCEYPSLKEAEDAVHSWTRAHCYDVRRQKGVKNSRGQVFKYKFVCVSFGKNQNKRRLGEGDRVRPKRTTKTTGCQMALWISAVDPKAPDGAYAVRHFQNDKSCWHNHPPPESYKVYPNHRRRARGANSKKVLDDLHKAKFTARQKMTILQSAEIADGYTMQDIYNYTALSNSSSRN